MTQQASSLTFRVCVDATQSGDLEGRLCSADAVIPFSNLSALLRGIGILFEGVRYPQASAEMRSFVSPGKAAPRVQSKETYGAMENFDSARGEKATFVVTVQCRQNATWQGRVTWVEPEITRRFRSALELIKLMDSAVGAEESSAK